MILVSMMTQFSILMETVALFIIQIHLGVIITMMMISHPQLPAVLVVAALILLPRSVLMTQQFLILMNRVANGIKTRKRNVVGTTIKTL